MDLKEDLRPRSVALSWQADAPHHLVALSTFDIHRSSKVETSPGAQQKRNAHASRECMCFAFTTKQLLLLI